MKMNLLNFSESHLLALLSASAVLRRKEQLKYILLALKRRKSPKRKIYEALLQTYLFAGFPSAIESLKIFAEYFRAPGLSSEKNTPQIFWERGEKNCRRIYGAKYEKLLSNIGRVSPELADWLVHEGYGKVLGRSGLSLKEREISVISILAALKFEDQLYSHINGGVRLGIKISEIRKVIENLDELGRRRLSRFGLKVCNKFADNKREPMLKVPVE